MIPFTSNLVNQFVRVTYSAVTQVPFRGSLKVPTSQKFHTVGINS